MSLRGWRGGAAVVGARVFIIIAGTCAIVALVAALLFVVASLASAASMEMMRAARFMAVAWLAFFVAVELTWVVAKVEDEHKRLEANVTESLRRRAQW